MSSLLEGRVRTNGTSENPGAPGTFGNRRAGKVALWTAEGGRPLQPSLSL